jgi:VWFA-related protein
MTPPSRHALPALLLIAALVSAQNIGQNASPGTTGAINFSTSTQLVVEAVTVKDKNGNSIAGLTAKDFAITEDGAPQTIRLFEYQKLDARPTPLPSNTAPPSLLDKLPHTQIAAEKPGNPKYRDRRLLALYFDMTAMAASDQARSIEAAEKFVRTQMTPADLMAVMMFEGGAVRVLQDFTADRDRLLSILQTMIVGEAQGLNETPADDSTPDTGAAFGQDDSEFNIFNTDRQLAALQTASQMLGRLSEKKTLIYFASGLRLNGVDNQAQLHATINTAIRAGVSFWPIDARGLVAEAPLGDATKGSPGGSGMYTGSSAVAFRSNFQRSQDTLWSIAADTNGKAFLDSNDLVAGILQAQKAVSSYYIIGYYTTNTTLDGRFRRIRITLADGLSATLDYRRGYYAGKQFNKFTAADKERQLEDALMLPDPITELTIAMEVDYFQLDSANYFVPLIVKIPGRELALARRGGADRTRIDFIGEVKDRWGTTIQNVRDKVDIKISDQTAAELAKRPIEYDTGFTLLPGQYTLKFLARDDETGRIGTYQTTFLIPNLNRETEHVPISSVVLGSQRVELKDALYNAVKQKERAETANPLVDAGQKLIPSVTRVFNKNRDLYVYLQAYEPAGATVEPVVAYVSLYRNGIRAFETAPLPVTQVPPNRLKTFALRFSLPLQQLPAGRYTCQVTVLEPAAGKAAFWRAPIMLIP